MDHGSVVGNKKMAIVMEYMKKRICSIKNLRRSLRKKYPKLFKNYPALDVAIWFINSIDREAGDSITNLRLQKFLYLSEAWHQVMVGEDLLMEEFEAWAHGPVVSEIYNIFKDYGWKALEPMEPFHVKFPEETLEVLNLVKEVYDSFTTRQLEEIVCQHQPYINARAGFAPEARCTNIIPKQEIKRFFKEKYSHIF